MKNYRNFRLAKQNDLPAIQTMYRDIVKHLINQGIYIWNDVYPSTVFPYDIEDQNLYVLLEYDEIIAAVALCASTDGEDAVTWNSTGKPLYISRLGVHPNYLKRGIGSVLIDFLIAAAKEKGAANLRLFVVDTNEIALRFYEKHGFSRVDGFFDGIVDGTVLREYGFERKII